MRIFIAGVMQGSIQGDGILDQRYREEIARALLARWPDLEVIDPFALHPGSVEYDDLLAKQTLLAMVELARTSDLLIAFIPAASMGTALEMYAAHEASVPVVAITPMSRNWVVRSLSRRVFSSLEDFLAEVHHVEAPELLI